MSTRLFEEAKHARDRGDYARAFDIYNCLAREGQPYALVLLADMYAEGQGTTVDLAKAEELLDQAASLGVREAVLQKADIWEARGDMRAYFATIQQAARSGLLPAQYALGICHARGLGTPRDAEKALEVMREAAERGHVGAKMHVARRLIARPLNPLGFLWGVALMLAAFVEGLYISFRNPADDRFR